MIINSLINLLSNLSKVLKPEDVYASLKEVSERWDSSTKLRAYILTNGVFGSYQKPLRDI